MHGRHRRHRRNLSCESLPPTLQSTVVYNTNKNHNLNGNYIINSKNANNSKIHQANCQQPTASSVRGRHVSHKSWGGSELSSPIFTDQILESLMMMTTTTTTTSSSIENSNRKAMIDGGNMVARNIPIQQQQQPQHLDIPKSPFSR